MEKTFGKINIAYFSTGLLLGLVIGIVFFNDTVEAPVLENPPVIDESKLSQDVLPEGEKVVPLFYSVEGYDQGVGMQVVVEEVSLPKIAWLAVREEVGGELGNVLGAQRLPVGIHKNIIIDLLRSTQSGHTYHIVIYEDDGDKYFDQRSDILVDRNGVIVESQFTAL